MRFRTLGALLDAVSAGAVRAGRSIGIREFRDPAFPGNRGNPRGKGSFAQDPVGLATTARLQTGPARSGSKFQLGKIRRENRMNQRFTPPIKPNARLGGLNFFPTHGPSTPLGFRSTRFRSAVPGKVEYARPQPAADWTIPPAPEPNRSAPRFPERNVRTQPR